MPDRLSSLDASFLYLEDSTTPMHVGSVMVFDPPAGGFDYERLIDLVSNRIAFVPRYRQRVRALPGGLLAPVWVDDEDFDLTYHVRRSALPRPGSTAQLEEFVARVQARALDRNRPLWELYLVEGLEDDRFAIVTKTHEALVDGVHAVDIGQVIVDPEVGSPGPFPDTWHASKEPSDVELLVSGVLDLVRSPGHILDSAGTVASGSATDVQHAAKTLISTARRALGALARTAARPAPTSPLNASIGAHRRFVMVETGLADYQEVRARMSKGRGTEEVTVHDVMLATITGALRAWLLSRGQGLTTGEVVRAMVPLGVHDPDLDTRPGEQVAACFIDLPVGEPSPMMRVHQVAYGLHQQIEGGSALSASALSSLAGFAPPTLHSLGARLGGAMSRRMFNLVVTNVPGPQRRMYAGEAALVASYPVIPLAGGQALTVGLTSYDGKVYFGLNADRDAMPDVDILGQCLMDALEELLADKEISR
ncbi:WS/DGAT/MGAT family O-acyltransferase [Leekyejoonella antrihumi]|uniref:Diacylglycerol O-acyltransferase n=1 Tax=Leekyejoonella antrihumi TaxID=1660198 RepID=A0A563DZP7_9MICO|nr:wax ester/triacylglycerol synthase family O-acyltransferase [Leekyejoonella antrihumi]TWP35114.1 wax ester/triacylglycerol synthase family O-acyltransferase [Leekyejoonella antrihumi]